MVRTRCTRFVVLAVSAGVLVTGCHTDMWVQPKKLPYQKSEFYKDGAASRPPIPGTVSRENLRSDDAKYRGIVNGKMVDTIPETLELDGVQVNTKTELKTVLLRGKERFTIFCSHCHGEAGDGTGMITQRGLALVRKPATYHTDRLRNMPIGHFFDVITSGYGIMFPQGGRVPPDDRWAISAYIRALQLSQYARQADVPAEYKTRLDESPSAAKPQPAEEGH